MFTFLYLNVTVFEIFIYFDYVECGQKCEKKRQIGAAKLSFYVGSTIKRLWCVIIWAILVEFAEKMETAEILCRLVLMIILYQEFIWIVSTDLQELCFWLSCCLKFQILANNVHEPFYGKNFIAFSSHKKNESSLFAVIYRFFPLPRFLKVTMCINCFSCL